MVLGTLHEAPVLAEAVRPKTARKAGHVERAFVRRARFTDNVANGDAQTVRERCIETRAHRRWYRHVRIHRPILGFLQRARSIKADGGGEILAKAPAARRAIVVDHAHLIVAKAVDAVFIEKKLRVLDQEVAYLRLAEVEHEPARVTLVGEIERVHVASVGRLAIEEVETLVAEVAAGVVVDDVQQHSETVQVAQIHERLELVHLAAEVLRHVAAQPLGAEQPIHLGNIRWEIAIHDG